MWLDLPFAQVSSSVEQNVHTTFSFPNPVSESEELESWGCLNILLFLMWFEGNFLPNQKQQQRLPQFDSILDIHHSRHILPAPFHIKIENTNLNHWIGSDSHSHQPFAPTLVSVSQIDRLYNKILWQLSFHFRHPWRKRKTDFMWQAIICTLSKTNKQNLMCERMLVDSA